ncbi:MAG TPA: hypothetical protein VFP34_14860 [Microlunatus sp.]|nr:hypothetical protein [Microlunatus sp.]
MNKTSIVADIDGLAASDGSLTLLTDLDPRRRGEELGPASEWGDSELRIS